MESKRFSRRWHILSNIAKKSLKVGAAVVVGVVVYQRWKYNDKVLYASWTTNYEPSVKWDFNWDRREPSSLLPPPKGKTDSELADYKKQLENSTPTASRHLLLIRHGQYFDNAAVDKDRFLTALGRAQAEVTGMRLKDLDLPYTVLISSTMTRAIETAKLIHKHLPELEYKQDEILREGAPIPPEPPLGSWRPEQKQFFQDGARIESAFRKYFYRADPSQKEDTYEVIVCHANVIRYFVCRALQFPPEAWLRFALANGSITHICIRPSGRVSVKSVGEHGHIKAQEISYN
ncbi:serine/threonine-protein phosphatase PGAM5 mitochondrial-like isoform X1 [Biomphalaria glabrata]|uniref:Serine/threonine-protein phosphatase PGAM5, mitochondrial n=2 Tax=Biomphalaria glabrata TaxID=6526 RepID=A0A2C9JTT7_BIOGL|nr:serine/threonine-protein phosphatase PGAM5, mitochondrial-like isoform X1 [Biomphalaria glabrata]KAI8753544.1 serine/threonine-protein phosphatase PGAM5; mitochondrial-like isoform X1 [Biomphalaria glabrata]